MTWCAIGADGGLGSDCRGSGDATFRGSFNVAFAGGRLYVTNTSASTVSVCDIVEGRVSVGDAIGRLMQRPLKAED